MPPAIASFTTRLYDVSGAGWWRAARVSVLAALHVARCAAGLDEGAPVPAAAFLLFWGLFNFALLMLVRRPTIAARCRSPSSFVLILLSQFKHNILLMTVNFVDLMVIDGDTFSFLMKVFPQPRVQGSRSRPRARPSRWCDVALRAVPDAAGARAGRRDVMLPGLVALFARGAERSVGRVLCRELCLQVRPARASRPSTISSPAASWSPTRPSASSSRAPADKPCTAHQPPHIIWCSTSRASTSGAIPEVKVPAGYGAHFSRTTARQRSLIVEGAGGPELVHRVQRAHRPVGALLRTFRRFRDADRGRAGGTRPAHTLRKCGYKTALYPMYGAFLSAQHYPAVGGHSELSRFPSVWVRSFSIRTVLPEQGRDNDRQAARQGPAVHAGLYGAEPFSWTFRFRPDLAPEWRDLGNRPDR